MNLITTKRRIGIMILLTILSPVLVVAPPPLDMTCWGTATLDGASAEGLEVRAYCGGIDVTRNSSPSIVVSGGYYSILVINDAINASVDGCTDGEEITFKIGGITADQTANFASGDTLMLDLTALSYHPCDINHNGIIIKDWNDLMIAYKYFLGLEGNYNNYYKNWSLMKEGYECFYGNYN